MCQWGKTTSEDWVEDQETIGWVDSSCSSKLKWVGVDHANVSIEVVEQIKIKYYPVQLDAKKVSEIILN